MSPFFILKFKSNKSDLPLSTAQENGRNSSRLLGKCSFKLHWVSEGYKKHHESHQNI